MECDAVAVPGRDQILTDAFKVAGEVYEFIECVGDDRFADIPPHRNCWPTPK
jgi:hypothetical protein